MKSNKPFEILSPDPAITAQVTEILRQNAIILEMNRDLLKVLSHPMVQVSADYVFQKERNS